MKALTLLFACLISVALSVGQASTPSDPAEKGMEGYRLFTRDSLPDDRERGFALITEAAWEGDAKAANNLGWLKQKGDYTEQDLPGALRWYGRAADQGLPAAALNYLDLLLSEPSLADGSLPERERLAAAAMLAGTALSMGRGLPHDYRKGGEMLLRAALFGDPKAAMTIAQQLEMYPDSFSYLPLEKLVEECDSLLQPDVRNLGDGISSAAFAELMLTPAFWYARAGKDALQL